MVQLSLQIPTGCSQGALHESLKLKLLANFNNLPYFQVYLHGLGSQLWTLDARLDNGVPITSARLRNKIRETILPAFEDSLQATDFKTFCEWFKWRGVAKGEWIKITEDTKPFPGVTQHFWGVMSDGDELTKFTPGYADAFFGVDASGCPASGGGGRTAAPAAATVPGAAVILPCRRPRGACLGSRDASRCCCISCCGQVLHSCRSTFPGVVAWNWDILAYSLDQHSSASCPVGNM